ncbi:MAG: (2Fe-2S)-binding protein [Acidobacteria bacterium]|nr:(2Fe-2S)-binding protein [Acidobacteriota bacterium]
MSNNENHFYVFLNQHNDSEWARVITELLPSIHPVDQRATRIWFAFFPIKLHRALANSTDPEETAKSLLLKGKYRLADQVDSSAEFLYGHRYWPDVKRAVAEYAATASNSLPLATQIREAAGRIAGKVKADESLLVGITAIAFGTLQQVGPDDFNRPAQPGAYGRNWKRSPDKIVEDRARDDNQGIFGFLKTVDKEFTVNFSEYTPGSTFRLVNMQDLTMAAAKDKRDHHLRDQRCMAGEGPIPVECRTSSCGTCWVGVLSPTVKISPPGEREINRWVYFGYEGFTGEDDSPIRLACQMKASGNVTIVIPPWNGMIGKLDEKKQSEAA